MARGEQCGKIGATVIEQQLKMLQNGNTLILSFLHKKCNYFHVPTTSKKIIKFKE